MKYCPSCRKEYEDRSDFCRIDGTLLRKTTTAKEKSRKEQIPRSKSPEVAEGLFVTEKVIVIGFAGGRILYRASL